MKKKELELAVYALAILKTKWWQFFKRNRLHKRAIKLAQKNGIKY